MSSRGYIDFYNVLNEEQQHAADEIGVSISTG